MKSAHLTLSQFAQHLVSAAETILNNEKVPFSDVQVALTYGRDDGVGDPVCLLAEVIVDGDSAAELDNGFQGSEYLTSDTVTTFVFLFRERYGDRAVFDFGPNSTVYIWPNKEEWLKDMGAK